MADTFTHLQPGDVVLVHSYGRWQAYEQVKKVERVTPKQVIIGGDKFNRETGRGIGTKANLALATPEKLEAIRLKQEESNTRVTFWREVKQLYHRDGFNLPDYVGGEELAIWREAVEKIKAIRAKNAESDK